MTANVAASIRARLLNKARSVGSEYELFLVRYACERFLYRLGKSVERGRGNLARVGSKGTDY